MSDLTGLDLDGVPASPSLARHFALETVRGLLTDRAVPVSDELCDDVELVISELVTNAVRAGSPTVRVEVGLLDGVSGARSPRVLVRVSDEAPGWPEPRTAAITDTGGRGLPLVSAVSASWGVRMADTGKTVWAEFDPATG